MIRLLPLLVLLVSCEVDPCDGVRDLAASPNGLELTEAEHPGWGSTVCLQCHPSFAVHAATCTQIEGLDVAAIDADFEDTTSCTACHGDNGADWGDE